MRASNTVHLDKTPSVIDLVKKEQETMRFELLQSKAINEQMEILYRIYQPF